MNVLGEIVEIGAIIMAIVGMVLGILGKASWWMPTWNPKAAPVLGAALTVAATLLGLLVPEPTIAEAIGLGAGFGASAVGVHNLGKRLGNGKEKE